MTLLIIGTGRSGTGYIAEVLNQCGVKCGHEKVYGPIQGLGLVEPEWKSYRAEASWMAAPFAAQHDGPVVWQRRNFLDTVDSLDRLGLFKVETDKGHQPYRAVIWRHHPEVFCHDNPLIRAAHFASQWCGYQEWDMSYTIEDLTPQTVRDLADLAGAEVEQETAEQVLSVVPQNLNGGAKRRTCEEIQGELWEAGWYDMLECKK